MRTLLLPLAKRGLLECSTEQKTDSTHQCPSESLWKCIRYEPPKFSNIQTIKAAKESSDIKSGASCRLLSAPDGTVRLRNTGHKRGWALEITRDVSVGKNFLRRWPLFLYSQMQSNLQTPAWCLYCAFELFSGAFILFIWNTSRIEIFTSLLSILSWGNLIWEKGLSLPPKQPSPVGFTLSSFPLSKNFFHLSKGESCFDRVGNCLFLWSWLIALPYAIFPRNRLWQSPTLSVS